LRRDGRRERDAADRARREMAAHACARSGAAPRPGQAVHAPGALGQGAELHRGKPRPRAHARRPHDARRADGAHRQAPGGSPAFPPRGRAGGMTTKGNNMREYAPLHLTILERGARVAEPMPPGRVTMDDPAFSVMTDLREVSAATTRPEETIDTAHAVMIRRAVRLLFVLDDDATVCGVITAT